MVVEETVIVTEMVENHDIITIKIDLTGEITVETQIEEILIEMAQEDEVKAEESYSVKKTDTSRTVHIS